MSQFDEKAAYDESVLFYYGPLTRVGAFCAGARWQHSQDASKIAELEKLHSMEAEAHHKTASLYRQARLESEQLSEKLRVATEALEGISNAAVCVALTPASEHAGILEHIMNRADAALAETEAE